MSSRGSGDTSHGKLRKRSTRNRQTRDPGRRAGNARGGRRHGGIAGARLSGKKTQTWAAIVNFMQDKNERRFYALLRHGDTRGAEKKRGGEAREVDRGAVEDIERREFLFV